MNTLSFILLVISGFSAGFLTAAAYVSFVSMLGIFPKVAAKTKTASQCILYENCLILGILFAVFLQFFTTYDTLNFIQGELPASVIGITILIFIGLFGGIYIGFLIGGLSEVLNVIPIYAQKTHIAKGTPYVIFSFALGKGIFALIQYFILDA